MSKKKMSRAEKQYLREMGKKVESDDDEDFEKDFKERAKQQTDNELSGFMGGLIGQFGSGSKKVTKTKRKVMTKVPRKGEEVVTKKAEPYKVKKTRRVIKKVKKVYDPEMEAIRSAMARSQDRRDAFVDKVRREQKRN